MSGLLGAAGGLLSGAGSLAGGILGSNAANKASGQIQAQLQQALSFGQGVYSTDQSNLNPNITAGHTALSSILGLLGMPGGAPGASAQNSFNQFTQTPAYTFPLQQGQLGLNRQLASSGLTGSGAALKDSTAFNQGYASQGLQGYLSSLGGLATSCEQASGTLGQLGGNIAGLLTQIYGGIGTAQASGTIGSAQALTQGLNGGLTGALGNNTSLGGSNSPLGQLLASLQGGGGGAGASTGAYGGYNVTGLPGNSIP
jgi:hypothetical protein